MYMYMYIVQVCTGTTGTHIIHEASHVCIMYACVHLDTVLVCVCTYD
jgi:hypothetical protein